MHELSLCRSIHGIVERARAEHGGRPVSTVYLQVGQLRQVVPGTLAYCWSLLTEDGPLAGSALEIDHVPVELSCRECAASTTVEHALVLVCGACGSAQVDVVRGEEFMVTSIDLGTGPNGDLGTGPNG